MELSAIWVVVIVLIGIAIGVYSICKGCQGLREQSAQAIANLQERNAPRNSANGQQASDGAGSDSSMYHISGSSVLDKNPPNYDEIMEPPPSYEETIKLQGATCQPTSAAEVSAADDTSCAQVNYAYTHSEGPDELSGPRPATTSNDTSTSTPATVETTVQMDQSSTTTTTHTTDASSSCTVAIGS